MNGHVLQTLVFLEQKKPLIIVISRAENQVE